MFDLVENQRKIATVGKQPIFWKVSRLRPSQMSAAPEAPFPKNLNFSKFTTYPGNFGITRRILDLSQHGLIRNQIVTLEPPHPHFRLVVFLSGATQINNRPSVLETIIKIGFGVTMDGLDFLDGFRLKILVATAMSGWLVFSIPPTHLLFRYRISLTWTSLSRCLSKATPTLRHRLEWLQRSL